MTRAGPLRKPAHRLERETGVEPATSTLARLHSTTELVQRTPGDARRARILPGDSGDCQGERAGGGSTGLEGVADEADPGRSSPRLEHFHDVEPAGALGTAAEGQVQGGRGGDPGALPRPDRLGRSSKGQRRAVLDLDEDEGGAVLGDEVDLPGARAVAALQDAIALGREMTLGKLLSSTPQPDMPAGARHVGGRSLGEPRVPADHRPSSGGPESWSSSYSGGAAGPRAPPIASWSRRCITRRRRASKNTMRPRCLQVSSRSMASRRPSSLARKPSSIVRTAPSPGSISRSP